jgi:hypothetical protein
MLACNVQLCKKFNKPCVPHSSVLPWTWLAWCQSDLTCQSSWVSGLHRSVHATRQWFLHC